MRAIVVRGFVENELPGNADFSSYRIEHRIKIRITKYICRNETVHYGCFVMYQASRLTIRPRKAIIRSRTERLS